MTKLTPIAPCPTASALMLPEETPEQIMLKLLFLLLDEAYDHIEKQQAEIERLRRPPPEHPLTTRMKQLALYHDCLLGRKAEFPEWSQFQFMLNRSLRRTESEMERLMVAGEALNKL
jgi:hypothetical protein